MCRAAPVLTLAAAVLSAGCTASPALTQAQLNAIETRVVEAGFDATFNAASGALFDAGYLIFMSDRTGGLLTGVQVVDDSDWSGFWARSGDEEHLAISVQVRPETAATSLVRIKTQIDGRTKVDQKAIDEIWVLMQQQVLMSAPHVAPENGGTP